MTFKFTNTRLEVIRLYTDTLDAARWDNKQEAKAAGLTEPMISYYRNERSDKALPLCVAANSLAGDELAKWLAEKRNGVFIRNCNHVDGTTCGEKCEVLKAMSALQYDLSPSEERVLWEAIAQAALQALNEPCLA
jgi:hypothetical protein